MVHIQEFDNNTSAEVVHVVLEVTMELVNVAGVDLGSLALHEVGATHLAAHFSLQLLVVESLVSLCFTMSLLKFLDAHLELFDLLDMLTFLLGLLVLHPIHLSTGLDCSLSSALRLLNRFLRLRCFLDHLHRLLLIVLIVLVSMSGARVHGL